MNPHDVKAARLELGLTQDQLAAVLGASRQSIIRWEQAAPPAWLSVMLGAFRAGYRPPGWPKTAGAQAGPPRPSQDH